MLLGEVPPVKDKVTIGDVLPEELQDKLLLPENILKTKIDNQTLGITLQFYSRNRKLVNSGVEYIGTSIAKYYLGADNLTKYPRDPKLAKDVMRLSKLIEEK